jgi:hypothetical protein
MEAITVAMVVYCVVFAVLILALSIYRGAKRSRKMNEFVESLSVTTGSDKSTAPPPSSESQPPHDAPSAKHAA